MDKRAFFTTAGVIITTLTPFLMAILKRLVPDWEHKAWAPPLIGGLGTVVSALTAGQIASTWDLLVAIGAGLGFGGLASSIRDVFRGK